MSYQLTYCNMENEENVVVDAVEETPVVEEVVEETEQA